MSYLKFNVKTEQKMPDRATDHQYDSVVYGEVYGW